MQDCSVGSPRGQQPTSDSPDDCVSWGAGKASEVLPEGTPHSDTPSGDPQVLWRESASPATPPPEAPQSSSLPFPFCTLGEVGRQSWKSRQELRRHPQREGAQQRAAPCPRRWTGGPVLPPPGLWPGHVLNEAALGLTPAASGLTWASGVRPAGCGARSK